MTFVIMACATAVTVPDYAIAQKGVPPTSVVVGGQAMMSDRDIMENLQASPELSTLVALLHATGLSDTLSGHGPFTVFAPTNAAFTALPPGMLDNLRKPENKTQLAALLGNNIVAGNFSSARLRYILRQDKGSVALDTVNEGKLTVLLNGPQNLMLKDTKGATADIIIYDAKQSNGVVFVTDGLMQPG